MAAHPDHHFRLLFLKRVQASSGCFGCLAVRIQTDNVFVQLFGVRDVILAFLELGGLEPLVGLVSPAGRQERDQT
jgi:hypothetical protein